MVDTDRERERAWRDLDQRLAAMAAGAADRCEGVLEPGGGGPAEQWARELAVGYGVDLALTWPVVMVAVSAACEGAVVLAVPTREGRPLLVPSVIQAVPLAASVVGKSTVMGAVLPLLREAEAAGAAARADHVAAAIAALDPQHAGGLLADAWLGGMCPSTRIGSATQEAIRNGLAENGGHQVVWTAESDVFQEAGKYLSRAGSESLSMFVHGWDQEDVIVSRAGAGTIHVPEASLPICAMMQPERFPDVTSGPDWLAKGVLHRMLLTRGERAAPPAGDAPHAYAYAAGAPQTGVAGFCGSQAQEAVGASMRALAAAAAPVRASRGALSVWTSKRMGASGVPRPVPVPRRVLVLAPDALEEYAWLQWCRERMLERVEEAKQAEGAGRAWLVQALAGRVTQHALRVALLSVLAADAGAASVGAAAVRDAGARVLPWLVDQWLSVMVVRASEQAEAGIAADMAANPRLAPRDGAAAVLAAVAACARADGSPDGWTALRGVRRRLPRALRSVRGSAEVFFDAAMRELVADGLVEVRRTAPSGGGRPSSEVRCTPHGASVLASG